MKEIISKENEIIKDAIKLKQKKYRDEKSLFLIESKKVVEEAIKNYFEIVYIFATKKALEKTDFLKKDSEKIIIVSEQIANLLSSTVNSQDIFAIVKKKNYRNTENNFLILDNLQDPQNLGAILRISASTNFKNIYLLNCVDPYNDKAIRASMGTIFKVNLFETTIDEIEKLASKYTIYSANMNGKNVFETKVENNICGLILGNEGNGVSKEVEKFANKILSIPMENNVESLNVGVSAGIICYYIYNFQKHI